MPCLCTRRHFLKPAFKIIIILVWILIFYLQFERPFIARTVQNITPALLVTTLLHGLFWLSWLAVPFLLFALIKGKSFCWNICPVGLAQDLVPSFGKTKPSKTNLYIFLLLFSGSFFGFNFLAFFDPIIIFNRALISFKVRLLEFAIFFIPITIILLLSIHKKRLWCFKLCPLGALLDWINRIKKDKTRFSLERRKVLISLGTGFLLGGLLKWKNYQLHPVNERLLRPPGALPENEFTDRCIRCGSCVSICLTRTLTPVFLESGVEGIFTPRLLPQIAECDEFCNKCGIACPTQAIKRLPLDIKRNIKIGTAKIDRSRCIAWSYNKLCLICREHCPYLAIEVVKNTNDVPSPKEIPGLCRGCGLCEKNCPAQPIRAIRVYNIGAGKVIDV